MCVWVGVERNLYDHTMSMKMLILTMKKNIYTSSKNYEESGGGLNINLLTISHSSHVPYPRRSELVGKNNHSRPIYLTYSFRILFLVLDFQYLFW